MVLAVEEGAVMEVMDKLKLVTEEKRVLELTDREKILIKVR